MVPAVSPVALLALSLFTLRAIGHLWVDEDDRTPNPHLSDDGPAPPAAPLGFLAAALGSHMVLQRAPQAAVVWGHTKPGAVVTTAFDGKEFSTTADVNGTWRQVLPPTPGSMKPYTLSFQSSAGEAASIADVLFGDVYLCGGQSNMVFMVHQASNATQEAQVAAIYPNVRLFTVGQKTQSGTPLMDLRTVQQTWTPITEGTISSFSAVCWFFGREISDALSPSKDLPLGLVSSNWGGTAVELWAPPEAFAACGRTRHGPPTLYNAMIYPFTVGPMSLTGFTWYQGEANTHSVQTASDYACMFPAMIEGWRNDFKNPAGYFGFVQLSTWCKVDPLALAKMRDAQLQALALPKVGFATNADHGAGCYIHPPAKQFCGKRLGDSALALQYGKRILWRSPTYKSASAVALGNDGRVAVRVELNDVSPDGLRTDVRPFNYLPGLECTKLNAKQANTCAWAAIQFAGGDWANATVSTAAGGHALLLEADVPAGPGLAEAPVAVATAYGYGDIPMMNAYDRGTDLPVLPWSHPIGAPSSAGTPAWDLLI